MFGIKYETWTSICDMYFSLKNNSLKSYLQWFPFTKLTNADKDVIRSKEFYEKYINAASFMLFPFVMHQTENFLQKGDGSFRDSSLISPVPYLIFQAIGKEIYEQYSTRRPTDISAYYAGNYEFMRPKYKQDYDEFFKELNSCTGKYQYFIKTDITNFFANINVDKLVDQIDEICNSEKIVFTQTQLTLFKELLKYCGNGKFPLIENSVASSFLATIVYLDKIDARLHQYITDNISVFSYFRMVRYVDDMYILIASDKPIGCLHDAYNEIRNQYSSVLKEYGLALNTKKCCLKETKEISRELRKSLYDEYINGQKHNIEELFSGSLQKFLSDLSFELLFDSIDIETYNNLIERHFSSDNIEFTPSEVFNYFVYENDTELKTKEIINEIDFLVEQSISFISLDPKRLTIMIMKTKSDKAIRNFLNQLFNRSRTHKWNLYDTTITISYLIQRKFQHKDLLYILSKQHPELYTYYEYNCKRSFCDYFTQEEVRDKLSEAIVKDAKAHYLYFMYLCEIKRENYMVAFAYFKNFFDRVTADLDYIYNYEPREKRPNYKKFYKEKTLVSFYSEIDDSEQVITMAHQLRNKNPLSHSSSELIDNENTKDDLRQSIESLKRLIFKYMELHMQ